VLQWPAFQGELHMSKVRFITGASIGIGLGLARFAADLIPGCRRFSPR